MKIKVIGIGGLGCNVIRRFGKYEHKDVSLAAIDTHRIFSDGYSNEVQLIQLGKNCLKGLPVANEERLPLLKQAIEETKEEIYKCLEKVSCLFIICGACGLTGGPTSKALLKIAKEKNIKTVLIIQNSVPFEGERRIKRAKATINELKYLADICVLDEVFSFYYKSGTKRYVKDIVDMKYLFSLQDKKLSQLIKELIDIEIWKYSTYDVVKEENGLQSTSI